MQALSGIALITAGVLLLVATRRACRMGREAWFTSDTFVMTVVGPVFIVSLAGGGGILLYPSLHGAGATAAIIAFASAAGVAGLATLAWLRARHAPESAAPASNVVDLAAKRIPTSGNPSSPDAPRPPVTPRTRKAA